MWALSACNAPSSTVTQTLAASDTGVPATATPTIFPTPEPVKALTVCTSELPDSLFLYSVQYNAARAAILAMTQDDLYNEDAGILSELPSEENGGLRLEPVTVEGGQTVVDARGELVVLKAGVSVRPSGCRDGGCSIIWDGESDLQMDRMVLDFHLVDSLNWSDGVPVTAEDSVFSYQLANAPDAPGLKWAEMRTASHTAVDERTVIWVGKPGFTTSDLEAFFWTPLPAHTVEGALNQSSIAALPQFSTHPLSYGPFAVASRSEDAILLTRNPHYFRADEGLPVLDEITVQAIGNDRTAALTALQNGTCDVLDASFGLENDPQTLTALQVDEAYDVFVSPTGSWEQLVFGIKPASYDEYFNPLYGDRPNFFSDERVRQAIGMCLDRDALLGGDLSAVVEPQSSFVSEDESQLPEGMGWGQDLPAAMALLEAAGWRDHDLDANTPLQAWEVAGVPGGTSFSVTLSTDTSTLQEELAGIVRESLGQCGIDVTVTSLPPEMLYAPGPDGAVFGRQFDLTFIKWQPRPDLDCGLYQSWQIPFGENLWIGTNIAGFADSLYDQACSTAILALPEAYASSLSQAEETFRDAAIAIPLFSIPHIMVATSEGCNEAFGLLQGDFFSLVEYYQVSEMCP
jgi:peptide/nickel transport system substrate-binding protein